MKYLSILLFFVLNITLSAQATLDFCGSLQGRSPWLKSFQKRSSIDKAKYRNAEMILVPLSIHLLAEDSGKGAYADHTMVQTICNLNEVFLSADIQFYILGDIHVIASSAFNDHSTTDIGGEFMLDYNIPNSLNCYVVSNPASNCGYNLPWAGIALSKSCMKVTDLTWAHEIGHALSLPHPFLGWEGGQTHDGTVGANFNNPAPTFVTYDYTDFKKVHFTNDTLIIDTSYVELVDGSNCHIAADGFCDTKPDYIAARWSCNPDGLSVVEQLDPNGVAFFSEGNILMGYSSATNKESNYCRGIFTEEQIQAMRANLQEEHSNWLDQEFYEFDGINNEVVNQYPTEGEKVDFQGVEISWELATGDADKYIVQIGIEKTLSIIVFDSIVEEQSMTLYHLDNNKKYYWRVRAFDNNEFCSEFNNINAFETADLSAINNLEDHICTVFPSILKSRDIININFPNHNQSYEFDITNSNGKLIKQQDNTSNESIEIDGFTAGLYFLRIKTNKGLETFKLLIE